MKQSQYQRGIIDLQLLAHCSSFLSNVYDEARFVNFFVHYGASVLFLSLLRHVSVSRLQINDDFNNTVYGYKYGPLDVNFSHFLLFTQPIWDFVFYFPNFSSNQRVLVKLYSSLTS
jgi:hypothetical protein